MERELYYASMEALNEWRSALDMWEAAPFGSAEYDSAFQYAESARRFANQKACEYDAWAAWERWADIKEAEFKEHVWNNETKEVGQ